MRELAAVIVGGLVGTGLRLGLDQLVPHDGREFPLSTLVINVVGSLLLGFLVARLWPVAPTWLRVGLGTGLIGSFTTFSALILSTLGLAHHGELLLAVVYLVVTLFGGFGAALLGLRLGGAGGAVPEVTTAAAAPGPGVSGAGVSGAGVSDAGVSGAGVSGPGVSGAGVRGPGVSGAGVPGAASEVSE